MNGERDELAKLAFVADNHVTGDPHAEWEVLGKNPKYVGYVYEIADAILAAGYRKPRTITTVEELDALPVGSVILDPAGLSLHKNEFTGWCASNGAKNISGEMLDEALPATVLYEAPND
jgi:hypothetical protein